MLVLLNTLNWGVYGRGDGAGMGIGRCPVCLRETSLFNSNGKGEAEMAVMYAQKTSTSMGGKRKWTDAMTIWVLGLGFWAYAGLADRRSCRGLGTVLVDGRGDISAHIYSYAAVDTTAGAIYPKV
jgi:hypothetical protein